MTYPSPYQPPQPPPGYDPYSAQTGDLLAPARRASVLMYVLGGIALVGSICCIGGGAMLPRLMAEHPEMFRDLPNVPGMTPQLMRIQAFVQGGLCLVLAVGLLAMAPFVRKGIKGTIIASLLLASLAILYFLLQALGSLLMGKAQGALGACMMIIPLSLFVMLAVSLIQALSTSGQVQAMRDQYAQQAWQSAYQQQMYRGAIPPNAGFTPPPPPPVPPPPPRNPDDPGV